MTKPLTVLKSIGPKLVPFFKTCTIFFVLFGATPAATTSVPWFFCIIKCLPIISLMLFVLLNGMNTTEYYRYSQRVLIGLIFSCLGDACLVWAKKYFEVGIGCFAVAQISYARAFGWKPFNPYAGAIFGGFGFLMYSYLSIGLNGIMVFMVAAYMTVICVMAWRAVARVQFFDDLVTWTKLSGCFGAIAFVISDLTLAIDRFRFHIPYAHPIIMLTYYAAQLGIALSVVDSQVDNFIESSKRDHRKQEEQELNGQIASLAFTGASQTNGNVERQINNDGNILVHPKLHLE